MMQDVFQAVCPTAKHPEKNEVKTSPASQLLRFADLVVMAGRLHPFPFRTRP
jgi:hypothetical protein